MATFVLVHGAFHGGWCWKHVARHVRAAGHEVFTPTLTGLGERSHLLSPAVNLSTHLQDVVNLLRYEDLQAVALVGHSYGGAVITGVAELVPEHLRQLIYLDAMIPDHGQTFFDAERDDDPDMAERWTAGATLVNGTLVYPGSETVWNTYLDGWHITDPVDVAWMKARLSPQPLATLSEPIDLSSHAAAELTRSFIRCSGPSDHPDPVHSAATRANEAGWAYHELATGHDAMITAPDDVAHLLLNLG